MMTQTRANWQMRLPPALILCIAFVLFFGVYNSNAQVATCGVGTRVEFEDGRNGIGTIEEIGTESPHVGWYRIVFSWSPKGEWFMPKYTKLRIAGTNTKCAQEAASNKPLSKNSNNKAPLPAQKSETLVFGENECPFNEPPGKVTKTSPASAALFKRVIFERAAAKINPDSISAPKRVGLTFLEFEMGTPYKNTLTSSRFGDKRRHDGAPVGAMIYPIKTKEMQCDLHGEQIRRSVEEVSRNCFKNRDGEWICPGRTTKTLESGLISIK
jgi:hypothetical protein